MAEEIVEVINEMTQAGYNQKVKELNYRKNEKRNEISEQIKYAKSLGDFSENAELDAAKNDENENEKEIARLEHEIATAKIIESRLYIIYDKDEEPGSRYYICELVGETESSITDHKISRQSQFALELQAHAKGEKFTVNEFEFKIIEDNARKNKQKDVDALNAQDK